MQIDSGPESDMTFIREGGVPPEFDGRRRAGVQCVEDDADGCSFGATVHGTGEVFGRHLPADWETLTECPECGGEVIVFNTPGDTSPGPK